MVLFGAKRLPQLGSGVGKGIRNFKKGLNSEDEAVEGDKGKIENSDEA